MQCRARPFGATFGAIMSFAAAQSRNALEAPVVGGKWTCGHVLPVTTSAMVT